MRLRFIPILLFATVSLLALKAIGLFANGGYTLGSLNLARAGNADTPTRSVMRPAEAAPNPSPDPDADAPIFTGSISSDKKPPESKPAEAKKAAAAVPAPAAAPMAPMPPGERAVLERLQERREELEARARELDAREGILKAAEKRLEARIEELKGRETQLAAAADRKEEAETARLKGLVTMYESMKPKEAARIFDRLDMKVLIGVVSQMAPRRMSEILAQMTPEAAERLTVELSARASGTVRIPSAGELPKIEGRPRG